MKPERFHRTPASSPLLPVMTVALAVAIFVVEAGMALDMAVAVLYVVVLLAANVLGRRGVTSRA